MKTAFAVLAQAEEGREEILKKEEASNN